MNEKRARETTFYLMAGLDRGVLKSLRMACDFKCCLFQFSKKYFFLREMAFLKMFIIHRIAMLDLVPEEETITVFNAIYQLKFSKKENIQNWFDELNFKIDSYTKSAQEGNAKGIFGVAGLFLIFLSNYDKSISNLKAQTDLANYLSITAEKYKDIIEPYS